MWESRVKPHSRLHQYHSSIRPHRKLHRFHPPLWVSSVEPHSRLRQFHSSIRPQSRLHLSMYPCECQALDLTIGFFNSLHPCKCQVLDLAIGFIWVFIDFFCKCQEAGWSSWRNKSQETNKSFLKRATHYALTLTIHLSLLEVSFEPCLALLWKSKS